MRTLCLLLLLVLELPIYAAGARDEFDPDSIVRVCRNVAAFRIARQHNNNWEPSPYFAGLMALYRLTGDDTYLDRVTSWAERHNWEAYNNPLSCNGDHECCFQPYAEVYETEAARGPKPGRAYASRSKHYSYNETHQNRPRKIKDLQRSKQE